MAYFPKGLVLLPLSLCILYITSQLWHNHPPRPLKDTVKATADRDCNDSSCFIKSRETLESSDYYEEEFRGRWELASENPGISAMHMLLFPNTHKAIMLDAVSLGPSNVRLPLGTYRLNPGARLNPEAWQKYVDYWAHAVEYDTDSAAIRPLKILTDTWSSSGGLSANGTIVISGGWGGGGRSVRYLSGCYDSCDWKEHPMALSAKRWFSTQHILPDGSFIVVGGRRMFNYEYILWDESNWDKRTYQLPFLNETNDPSENNLYPFVFLSTDGNLFIFANDRSILLNPSTNTIVHTFPVLRGGSRNYPASASAALLPIKLHDSNPDNIRAEVLVCGGAKPEAAKLAGKGEFMNALQDCGRIEITNQTAKWQTEMMPSPRVIGDMLILPTGDVLIINGAKKGTAGWNFADEPNMTPVLYEPDDPVNERFTELTPTSKPRMCHSTSAVLPDGKILVAGSNPNLRYNLSSGAKYPTELRVEKFYPPYLDESLASYRPSIVSTFEGKLVSYGQNVAVQFKLEESEVSLDDLKVTMYAPPFTTHGVSMGQRLLVLATKELIDVGSDVFQVSVMAPPTAKIAPPSFYLLFVVYRQVPSPGTWVQIG